MQRLRSLLLGAICAGILSCSSAYAQNNSFKQTNLVSDSAGLAANTDPDLLNPWGVAFVPGQSFWIANNNSGTSRLFDRAGTPKRSFAVPPPRGSSNPSTPTGIVANVINGVGAGFEVNHMPSRFIFATEDGTISGWNGVDTDAILAVDNSAAGAVYKGLAIVGNDSGDFILATNFSSGNVEAYNAGFGPTALSGIPFLDPTLPAGFAPFGIQVIANSQVVVTYAQQDALRHDPIHSPGAGFVSLFDANGGFIRRIASQGTLNAPWGVTVAPATFGSFPGALLVGNFGDGTINAFNLGTGAFLGHLKDSNGAVITTPTLWNLLFDPSGRSGDPNTLYITAGLGDEKHGLFAAIAPDNTPAATPDFTIASGPANMTINAGQPAPFTVTVSGLNGFNSAVNLSCSGLPINSTCSFNPTSVAPASGGMMTSTMNITTSSSPYHAGALITLANTRTPSYAQYLLIAALGFLALLLARSGRYRHPAGKQRIRRLAYSFGFFIASAGLLAAGGCGYGSGYNTTNSGNGTQRGTTTVMITGTSGNLIHSTSVTLTVR
jgi:uncharacterized protein (TIGR03118 family)